MADYIFEVPLTNKGRDAIDPDILDSITSKGVSMIPRVTYNNLSVESVRVDLETKRIYYGVNGSPAMKAGLASLNAAERLAWWNTLLAGVAIAGAIVCVIVFGAPALIPAAVVVGIALAYSAVTGIIEVEATKADTKQEIVKAITEGTITPEEGNDLLEGVDKGWSSIPWTGIIIGGLVGIFALAALYIFLSTRRTVKT